MGITEPDTALLTHETNTCKLFKNISIKLPGWLRAAPIRSARAPSSPQPIILEEGKISSRGFCTLFPGTISFWDRTSSRQQAAWKGWPGIGPWPSTVQAE